MQDKWREDRLGVPEAAGSYFTKFQSTSVLPAGDPFTDSYVNYSERRLSEKQVTSVLRECIFTSCSSHTVCRNLPRLEVKLSHSQGGLKFLLGLQRGEGPGKRYLVKAYGGTESKSVTSSPEKATQAV